MTNIKSIKNIDDLSNTDILSIRKSHNNLFFNRDSIKSFFNDIKHISYDFNLNVFLIPYDNYYTKYDMYDMLSILINKKITFITNIVTINNKQYIQLDYLTKINYQ